MRRRTLFGKPIRRLKIFRILALFTVILTGAFFGMRFWYEGRIADLEQERLELDIQVRSIRLPELTTVSMPLELLVEVLPANLTASDVRIDVAILVEESALTLDQFNSTVSVSTNAPGLEGLSSDIRAWRVRSTFVSTNEADLVNFINLLEEATLIYNVQSFNVFRSEEDSGTVYQIEVIYFTYSIQIP